MNRGITRRRFVYGCAAGFMLAGLGGLSACASGNSDGESAGGSAAGGKLTIVYNDAPSGFDPANNWDGWYTCCRGLTETLVAFDENMDLAPWLATAWENEDELTWRFTIREGVVFHSGAEMTPDAVRSSLLRTVELSTRAADKIHLDRIDVDGNDLVITTTTPVATLPGELAEPVFSIIDVDAVDTAPANCGTGPFQGDDTSQAERFTLKANADYWQGAPAVDAIECRTITDASARALGLQSGEADIAASLLASDLQTLRDSGSCTVLESESVRTVFMFCNFRNETLADPDVRRALSFACDRETLCESLLNGALKPNGAPFPAYLPYSQSVQDAAQTYDVDQAKQLLANAGWADGDGDGILEKNGVKLSLRLAYYSSRPELPLLAPALQDAYAQIGVEVTPQVFENIDTVLRSGDFDLMLYNTTTAGNGDPSYFLSLYFASGGSENAGGYANDDLDAVVAQLTGEFDEDTRYDLAEQAERLILGDCPDIFVGTAMMNAVEGPGVSGYRLYPVEYYGVTAETGRADG